MLGNLLVFPCLLNAVFTKDNETMIKANNTLCKSTRCRRRQENKQDKNMAECKLIQDIYQAKQKHF